MNTIEMPQTYTVGQGVRTLVPVQIAGWASPCTPGYLFWVVEDDGDTVVIRRDSADATAVAKSDIEPAYQVVNSISYDSRTTAGVISILEKCRQNRTLVRIHYGFTETHEQVTHDHSLLGRDWLEENDMRGRIGSSTGRSKIPLMVAPGADGGYGLLDACIVKIRTLAKVPRILYQHPNYHTGKITIRPITPGEGYTDGSGKKVDLFFDGYRWAVDVDGSNQANFKNRENAVRYLKGLGVTAIEVLGQ